MYMYLNCGNYKKWIICESFFSDFTIFSELNYICFSVLGSHIVMIEKSINFLNLVY